MSAFQVGYAGLLPEPIASRERRSLGPLREEVAVAAGVAH